MAKENVKQRKIVGKPTQSFVNLSQVKDDILILKDGTLRAVLAVSSTNFDLKNEDEQNALIYNYQRFLNSLDYPVQILMQSRKMDISDYLENLKRIMERQTNELLRMQTAEYIDFIDRLVESTNVMNKNFYVVVSYNQSVNPVGGGLLGSFLSSGKARQISDRERNFDKYKVLLNDRLSAVANNLGSIGLRVVRLNTEQLIELLYNSYNFAAGPAIDASQLDNITLTDSEAPQ